ncbi:HD domain-containing protein [Clostridium sp. SYSU_GA19001]|uniref:HD domain-containing phosphohydrolase n=1 Tax=Clostridium caldaquaticum TaxID=2940653 RepID=UPI0020770EB3|nr:HD domain-containing phosphohydrolase [Clostridium caldaquaticum]MCM8711360.1 HD domain-containing protein [Clostridium caldaquaticum]
MSSKEKSIGQIYKKHIKLIIILISATVLSIFFLLLINLNRNYKDSNLVNVLGKQSMLTQMMAKNTGRIYTINSVLQENLYDKSNEENLKYKLSQTIKKLEDSKDEYDRQYSLIKKGYVVVDNKKISFKGAEKKLIPVFEKNDEIWSNFKESIDIVLKEQSNSQETIKAIKYINENNEKLLNYSEEITRIVLDYNNKETMIIYYIIIILAVLMLVFLALFINKAYKELFVPISQLYKGMSQLGITLEDSLDVKSEKNDLMPVFSEVNMVFNQLNSLITLIENLNKNIPFKDILEYIFKSFSKYIPYTHIGVALIDDDGKTIKASYGISDKVHKNLAENMAEFKIDINKTSLSRIVESGKERIINDLEEYVKKVSDKEYNKILLEAGIRASITFPLKNKNEVIGIIFFSSNIKNVYRKEHVRFLRMLANSIVLSLEKDIFNQDMIISSTLALAKLTEERDLETGEHLYRMKIYSKMIAKFLSKEEKYKNIIDLEYINNIERFSPLHDIGKVAIRDEILLKPGKLTAEEFEIMKTHALYGAKVLKAAEENLKKKGRNIFFMAIEIAEGHHEKWDGSGYPYGKKGEEIPLSARIVAIADAFDALTSKRPYKEPFSFEHSVKIINEGSGTHFDPYIVEVFNKNIDKIKSKYLEFKYKNIL